MDKDTRTDTDTQNEQQKNVKSVVKQYRLPVSAVLFIFGTTANVIVIIIITCNKDMRTVSNMYILNLAISDIVYVNVFFLFALTDRKSITWLIGEIGFAFLTFWFRMSVGLTAYSVAVLSIQRYRVTVKSIHVRVSSQPTWRGAGAIICVVWIVAALFAIPAARCPLRRMGEFLRFTKYYQLLVIFHLLVSCVLPLCVIAFSYTMTARRIVKSPCSESEETQNPQLNTRRNTAKVLLGLAFVLLITYVPTHIFKTYLFYNIYFHDPFEKVVNSIENLLNIAKILDFILPLNSCLNPVALFCTSLAFRRHFKRYLTCCCKTKSPPPVFELSIIE
jgi:hypothetical protein